MAKAFRTFVILKNGGGPRYEVVGWGADGNTECVMLSPIGGGKDLIISKTVFRRDYIKAD